MSDGTLRLFGMLLAVLQPQSSAVLAIEEPEVSVHFGALNALVSVIQAQTEQSQIVLTTHSSDLMDLIDIDDLRLVRSHSGSTVLEPIAEHSKEAVRRELFSPGELVRAGGLQGLHEPVADSVT
jgi:predicted ATPase